MRANTVSVDKAIKRYLFQVFGAFFLIMILGFVLGLSVMKTNGPIGLALIFGGFVVAGIVASILHAQWIVWAFHNVDKPNLLYQSALRRNLLKPRKHFYNKLTITLTVDKDLYNQAWDKMLETGDLSTSTFDLPINKIVEVKYASKYLVLNIVLFLVFGVGYAYLASEYDSLAGKGIIAVFAGPFVLIALGYETYKLWKNQGKTAMVFTPEYFEFFEQQFKWQDVLTFRVFVENKTAYKATIAARTNVIVDGKAEMYSATKDIHSLDASPDKIEELYAVYKELYTPKS